MDRLLDMHLSISYTQQCNVAHTNSEATTSAIAASPTSLTTNSPVATMAPLDSTGAPKVAITRLPRSTVPAIPAAPPSPPPAPVSHTARQRKKSAHNAIERRYRTNLNDRIAELRAVVPALSHLSPDEATTAARKSTQDGGIDEDDHTCIVDGVAAATRLNKATILRKATEYITHLQSTNRTLRSEQHELRNLLLQLPGGAESLARWEASRPVLEDVNSPTNEDLSSANESPNDEAELIQASSSTAATIQTNTGSGNASRTLLAAFAGVCLVYSPVTSLNGNDTSSTGQDNGHGHVFAGLSALPGVSTLFSGLSSVTSVIPQAAFGWLLRFTGLFVFIWLLGAMPFFLQRTSSFPPSSPGGKKHNNRRATSTTVLRANCINQLLVELQQRSTVNLILNGLRELAILGARFTIGVTWPRSVQSAAQGLSAVAANEAEMTALRLVCEQSVVGVEQVGHYGLLATLYAAIRLANHTALPNGAPGFGKHTRDPNNAIAIAVALQSRLPIRLLSDWIVHRHWEHAQQTAAIIAAPAMATGGSVGRAGRDDRGEWVGMSLSSLANSASEESDDCHLHSEEDDQQSMAMRLPVLNTALARLELPCLLAQLDQLYQQLVMHPSSDAKYTMLPLQLLGAFARLNRYAILDTNRQQGFGQAVAQARWLAVCGATLAAFKLGQLSVFEQCVQGINQLRMTSNTIDQDRSFRHVWLSTCAVLALHANDLCLAACLNHTAASFSDNTPNNDSHTDRNMNANEEEMDKPRSMIQQMLKRATFMANEVQAHVYVKLYQQVSAYNGSILLLRGLRKRALAALAIVRRQCPQIIDTPAILSNRVARYQLTTHILVGEQHTQHRFSSFGITDTATMINTTATNTDCITVNNHSTDGDKRPLIDRASLHPPLPPHTPIAAAMRHIPRGHAWCRDVSGVRAN
ncbi:hypothetical protein BDF19DRAFT_445227 [Syncephalis fuscata]|nr:hypothetical protein BDF19DRAFT_445227 [Syncephalis fuscata]